MHRYCLQPEADLTSVARWRLPSSKTNRNSWDLAFLRERGRYSNSKSSGFDLDLQRSTEVKNIFTIRKPIHDFLSNFY